jgi:hypothetical protein
MSELINRDDALAVAMHSKDSVEGIKHLPAVDAVEVTRCRYCKYHHWEQEPCHGKTEHFCSVLKAQVFADFYCYYGKPKDGE